MARHALAGSHFEWACFAAQQSAEKAVKALHERLGREAWGHSVTELLEALGDSLVVEGSLLDCARALDKLYVPSRYPNGLPAGAPVDFFTRAEAERAIEQAELIVAFCERELSRP